MTPAIAFTPKRGAERPVASEARESGPRLAPERLRSEWPLLAFSLILTAMVTWYGTAVLQGGSVHGPSFVAMALVAMTVSTLHLGRPARAWRAVLNARTSWVSREILAFSAFGVTAAATALTPLPAAASWCALALGWIALVCVDMVYRVPGQRHAAVPHSAMTSLTAPFLVGLLVPWLWLAAAAGLAKALLFPWKAALGGELPWPLTLLRIGLGLIWPLAIAASGSSDAALLLAGPVVGEILDRTRFYAELQFMTPTRQIALDLGPM